MRWNRRLRRGAFERSGRRVVLPDEGEGGARGGVLEYIRLGVSVAFFPLGVFLFEEVGGPVAVPGVSVATFAADFGEGGFGDSVAVAEDGFVGFEVVEAGPEGWCAGGWDDDFVVVGGLDADVLDFGGLEPGDGAFDGGFDFGGWVFEADEEACDADGFGAAEGGEFVGARGCGGEGFLVVLGAPDGGFAVDVDLAFEDAADAEIEGFGGGGAVFFC